MDYKEFLIIAMLLFIGLVLYNSYRFETTMFKNWYWQKKVNESAGDIMRGLQENQEFLKEKIESLEKTVLQLEYENTFIRTGNTYSKANAEARQSRA